VLAYYAATTGNGQALSERQAADMQATFASLPASQQLAVREQIAEWHSGSPLPSKVVQLLPQTARDTRDLGNLGATPAKVPENSLREYDTSGGIIDVRGGVMNEMSRLQNNWTPLRRQ